MLKGNVKTMMGLCVAAAILCSGGAYSDGEADGIYVLNGYGEIVTEGAIKDFGVGTMFGWDIGRAIAPVVTQDASGIKSLDGFYLLDGMGGVFTIGDAVMPMAAGASLAGVTPPYFGWDIATDIQTIPGGNAFYVLDGFGGVFPVGGSLQVFDDDGNPANGNGPYFGWDVARAFEPYIDGSTGDVTGYYVLDGWGVVHSCGAAPDIANQPWFGWDIARDIELTPSQKGAYMIDGFGGLHTMGNAHTGFPGSAPYFGVDVMVDLEVTTTGHSAVNGLFLMDKYGIVYSMGAAAENDFVGPVFPSDIAQDLETSIWTTAPVTAPVPLG